jgi:hypothetical protein
MTRQELTILGVYRPQISAETWGEQRRSHGSDEYTREHFEQLVLIEAIVDNLSEPFDMAKFGQMQAEHPDDPSYMQVGYDEGLLSIDGESLIEREMDCVSGTGPLRFAVYLHYYDPQRPLKWQRGEVVCPPVQEVPVRLSILMAYTACD